MACNSTKIMVMVFADHPTLPSGAQPDLCWKTLSHLKLVLEPCRITFDARGDGLVCLKGRFNFDAFGLNSCFLISRNCSQFSCCQFTALRTSPLSACCVLTSLSSMITLVCRGMEQGEGETCICVAKLEDRTLAMETKGL